MNTVRKSPTNHTQSEPIAVTQKATPAGASVKSTRTLKDAATKNHHANSQLMNDKGHDTNCIPLKTHELKIKVL